MKKISVQKHFTVQVCETIYETKYETAYKQQCSTVYETKCEQFYRSFILFFLKIIKYKKSFTSSPITKSTCLTFLR
jgi:hypothetical protein